MDLHKIARENLLPDETTIEKRPITDYNLKEIFLVRNYLTYIINNYLNFYKELTPLSVRRLAVDFLHVQDAVEPPGLFSDEVQDLVDYMEVFFGKNMPIKDNRGKTIYAGGILTAHRLKGLSKSEILSRKKKARKRKIRKTIETTKIVKR